MSKTDLRFLWDMAFSTAMMFARWTRTTVDDSIITVLRSDAIFEELWAILEAKGFVKANRVLVTKAQAAAVTITVPTAGGESQVV